MAIRSYHDLILFTYGVRRDERGRVRHFRVRVFDSPEGQGERDDPVEVGALEYESLISQSRELEERGLDLKGQIALGHHLGRLLLPPYARGLYDRSLAWLKEREDEGLRLRLRLEPELSDLPWEYIYLKEPGSSADLSGFVVLNPRISIVRHEALALRAEWFAPPQPAAKRRVVIAMATPQPHEVYDKLTALPAEQRDIDEALKRVRGIDPVYLPKYDDTGNGDIIPGASFDDVKTALQPSADIFHFSGHGEFPLRPGPGGALLEGKGWIIFADQHNQAERIDAAELVRVMDNGNVRLVVLGACETARRDAIHKLNSCAVSLLAGRVGCVVAMQFTIYSHLAAIFVEAFYEALVAGLRIYEAVALGRGAIRDKILADGAEHRDWGVPVLYLRAAGGRIFNPVTDDEASQEAGRRSGERFDLNTAWWKWMEGGVIATEEQLHRLAEAGAALALSPMQVILLLRSAEARFVSVSPWLERLRRDGGELVLRLDDPAASVGAPNEARKTLGLDDGVKKERPWKIGPVAWAAVHHEDSVTRRTAALALTALQPVPDEGLERLDKALGFLDRPWERLVRKAELRGAQADADPQVAGRNAGLPPTDRAGIWLWRVWRRVYKDRERILALTLGGGIGAGLGLGLLRKIVAFLAGNLNPWVYFSMYAYLGGMLGAALCLGMMLAQPVLLRPPGGAGARSSKEAGLSRPALAAILGTVFFGVAQVALAQVGGLSVTDAPLVVPLGFVLGLGLSLAVYDQPATGWRLERLRALLRLGAAVGASVLAQAIFLVAPNLGTALTPALAGGFYEAYFTDSVEALWPDLAIRLPHWPDVLGLVDAGLVGGVLAVGLTVGMFLAERFVLQWRELVERAGE
jgi:hypothetical protein